MRTIAIGLLIWLVIMLSERVNCMEGPFTIDQKLDASGARNCQPPHSGNPQSLPALYSEIALKKLAKEAYRKGYAQGMVDGNQVIVCLDAQRQQMLNQNLNLQERVTEARAKIEILLGSMSFKITSYDALQEILALLEQACQQPK